MRYTIYHLTRFRYNPPVAENVMEVRMQPLSDARQTCLDFSITARPTAHIFSYVDHTGAHVHHFDVPGRHSELSAIAVSIVEVANGTPDPATLPAADWKAVDALAADMDFWDHLHATPLTSDSDLLSALARELDLQRGATPLATLLHLNARLHQTIAYAKDTTHVDSPIEETLRHRQGVCQDYAHIMLALLRHCLGIPARYVSGYLYHSTKDRSVDGAGHAWVEAWLPDYGWLGLDPTNNILAGDRHVRVGVGRDYRDAPPTRGVYRGTATGDLLVRVRIRRESGEIDVNQELSTEVAQQTAPLTPPAPADHDLNYAQQQQQQQ